MARGGGERRKIRRLGGVFDGVGAPDRKRESAKPYGPRLVVPPEAPFTRPSRFRPPSRRGLPFSYSATLIRS